MRYYDYISRAKVEMLHPQLRSSRSLPSWEVGIDVKVVGVHRKSAEPTEPSIFEKLIEVEDWIHAHEPVGSPTEPDAWIYGRESLYAMTFTGEGELSLTPELDQAIVYAAKIDEGSRIILCGSAHHQIGTRQCTNEELGWSSRHWLGRAISIYAREIVSGVSSREAGDPLASTGVFSMRGYADKVRQGTLMGYCEFLAKRLETSTYVDKKTGKKYTATLATPLYIALIS